VFKRKCGSNLPPLEFLPLFMVGGGYKDFYRHIQYTQMYSFYSYILYKYYYIYIYNIHVTVENW